MKLVRLATDNDGKFASAFGNDMIIAKDSQMALLNLTFKSNGGVIVVVPQSAKINFHSDIADANSQEEITMINRSYTISEAETFYNDIQHALNKTLQSEKAIGATDVGYNSVTSAFRISTTSEGLKTIEWRIAPFINPITNFGNILYQQMNWANAQITMTITGAHPSKETIINKANGEPASLDRKYKVLPLNGRRLNDGSSMFTARVRDLIDNTSGNQDNGFGIGLSKTNLSTLGLGTEDTIPDNMRDFEIRINRKTETYKYINDNTTEKDSGVNPARITLGSYPDVKVHDVMMFKVSGNLLYIGVAQDNGAGVFHQFGDPIEILAGEELYPYLYIRGAEADCKIDMFNFSIDPWLPSIGGNEKGNDNWGITGQLDTALANGYEDVISIATGSVVGHVIPQVGAEGRLNIRTTQNTLGTLIINNAVLRALGFTQFQGVPTGSAGFARMIMNNTTPQPGWKILSAQSLPAEYKSDNFIIESMSLPLDSFDASKTQYPHESTVYNNPATDKKGRRKNILMTIPENNNGANGLIEYEASNPIFIDINNADEINAKNLNFRILNKDFSELVQADETAIMTILIKKPNE